MAKREEQQDFDKLDKLISSVLQSDNQHPLPTDFSKNVMKKITEAEMSTLSYQPLIGKKTWGLIIFLLLISSVATYFSGNGAETSTWTERIYKLLQPLREIEFNWLSAFNQPSLAFSILSVCGLLVVYFYFLTRKSSFQFEL